MTDTKRPLWEVMQNAYDRQLIAAVGVDALDRLCYAAEIRAIAEEASRRYEGNDPAISIIAWLETEADRAEVDP